MVRRALQDVRLAVRAERVADVGVERVRVGRERVVGVRVDRVGMRRRVERVVGRRSGARARHGARSNERDKTKEEAVMSYVMGCQ